MVSSGAERANGVEASWQTAWDCNLNSALAVASIVDAFEEDKLGRVADSSRVEGIAAGSQ